MFDRRTRLIIRKAVCGLDTSPRDWGLKRDRELKDLVIWHEGLKHQLYQSYSEPGLWMVSAKEPRRRFAATKYRRDDAEEIEGWIAVYVDDLMVAAMMALAKATVKALQGLWACSEPESGG